MIKFGIVGTLGFFVDAGSLYILTRGLFLSLYLGQAFSFTIAVVHNFIWNRRWTFPESRKRPMHGQMVRFYLTNLGGLIIRSGIIAFVAPKFERLSLTFQVPGIPPKFLSDYASLSLAILIVTVWNYVLSRWWTFRHLEA
jgi:putative flippase GtrA